MLMIRHSFYFHVCCAIERKVSEEQEAMLANLDTSRNVKEPPQLLQLTRGCRAIRRIIMYIRYTTTRIS